MTHQIKDQTTRIAVCSRSFSRDTQLRQELESCYSNITFNDEGLSLDSDTLVAFLKGHSKAIVGLERINRYILEQVPELKVVSKYGVGLDKLDLPVMRELGVHLGWTPGVNKRSVSELVIALTISLLRHVHSANSKILAGEWRQIPGSLLSGRTVGIIGCGNIGKDLVPMLKVFGCRVLVNDILNYDDFYRMHSITAVDLETLLSESDVVTLHVPLDHSTENILDSRTMALMKPSAVLINLARGGLVDENCLKNMLKTGRLSGAAFDVFAKEPPEDTELLALPNFMSTPHIGGSAREAILAMGQAAIEGLENNRLP